MEIGGEGVIVAHPTSANDRHGEVAIETVLVVLVCWENFLHCPFHGFKVWMTLGIREGQNPGFEPCVFPFILPEGDHGWIDPVGYFHGYRLVEGVDDGSDDLWGRLAFAAQ